MNGRAKKFVTIGTGTCSRCNRVVCAPKAFVAAKSSMTPAARTAALAAPPPSEFLVMSFGTFPTPGGDFVFDRALAEQCSLTGRVTISTEDAVGVPPAGENQKHGPLLGTCLLAVRDDGLYATAATWTLHANTLKRLLEYGAWPVVALKVQAGTAEGARVRRIFMTNKPTFAASRSLAPPEPHPENVVQVAFDSIERTAAHFDAAARSRGEVAGFIIREGPVRGVGRYLASHVTEGRADWKTSQATAYLLTVRATASAWAKSLGGRVVTLTRRAAKPETSAEPLAAEGGLSYDPVDTYAKPALRIAMLRRALVEVGRIAGSAMVDEVSDSFLSWVPNEVKLKLESVTGERDRAYREAYHARDQLASTNALLGLISKERDEYKKTAQEQGAELAAISGVLMDAEVVGGAQGVRALAANRPFFNALVDAVQAAAQHSSIRAGTTLSDVPKRLLAELVAVENRLTSANARVAQLEEQLAQANRVRALLKSDQDELTRVANLLPASPWSHSSGVARLRDERDALRGQLENQAKRLGCAPKDVTLVTSNVAAILGLAKEIAQVTDLKPVNS